MRRVNHLRCSSCSHEWNDEQHADKPRECPDCGAENVNIVGNEDVNDEDEFQQLMIALEEEGED